MAAAPTNGEVKQSGRWACITSVVIEQGPGRPHDFASFPLHMPSLPSAPWARPSPSLL